MQPVATQFDASKQNKAGRVVTQGWVASEVNQFRMNAADPPYVTGAYIDDFLRTYYPDSPLIGQGNTIKELSDYFGIAVGAAMGVWAKETTFGRAHPGLVDHNYGCIRHTSEWPAVWYGGSAWNKYPDKRTGIAAWFKLVRWYYVETGQGNYNDFLNKYSPSFENNQATFKNIMWGVLKAFGYNMSASVLKTNHSQQSDDPKNIQVTQSKQPTVIAQPKRVGGNLTETGSQGARGLSVSVIGDSLGVGTQSPLASLITDINFDVLGSRQITHSTDSLNATKALQNMLNAGTLKDFVVFIIGTNRGVTKVEVDAVVNLIGNRKLILVTTASQVAHNTAVRNEYLDASKRHNNVYVADWYAEAQSFMAQYYTVENGKYIHMTATGYRKHAEFIAQAVHEANTAVFVGQSASKVVEERISIEDVELTEEGVLTYDGQSTDIGIKGYYSPLGDTAIYNRDANQRWGYGSSVNSSNWIDASLDLPEVSDPVELMLLGIKDLGERKEPAAQYRINLIDIDPNISIGDTGIFVDHEFNPPLYIQARILSITTSKTNANLNQVLIGNVVELVPQEKDYLHAIRAEIQASREQLRREEIEASPITAQITSNNGLVLGDSFEETLLEVQVYQGIHDITDQFSNFKWERVSDNPEADVSFNADLAPDNTLLIKTSDIINNQAKFTVKVFNDADEIVKQANIDIKRVETALWIDTDTPPETAKEGSKWVAQDGTQKVKVNGEWEDQVDQAIISQVRVEVEGAMAEAEQAKQDAINKANQALADAKAYADAEVQASKEHFDGLIEDMESEVADAQATADSAVEQIDTAVTNAGFTSLTDSLTGIQSISNTAQANSITALENAQDAMSDASTAVSDASQAISDASQAKTDAQTAISQAGQAISSANTAKTDAQTAIDNAQSALATAGNAKSTANALSVTVNDLEGEVELKASQTEVDGISGTVSTHATTLTQQATAIASKAEKSVVDTLSGTVSNQGTLISQNATAITSKADSSTVDTLEGIVSAQGTTITQQADLIESKASQSEVDTVKGTVATHTTTLSQHADQIASKAESSLVNTIKGTVDTHSTEISQNSTDIATKASSASVNTLTGRVSTAETGISQNADAIKLKASQSSVDTLAGTVSTLGSEFDVVAGQVSSKVWMTDIDGIEVGGRNLLLNSSFENGTNNWLTYDVVSEINGNEITVKNDKNANWPRLRQISPHIENIKKGETYTLSFEAKGDTSGNSDVRIAKGDASNLIFTTTPTYTDYWKKYTYTFKAPIDSASGVRLEFWINAHNVDVINSRSFRNLKLEKGNKATDWSPAPEDTDAKIDYVESEWTQTFESFEQTIIGEGGINKQLQTLSNTLSTIIEPETGRLSIVEQTTHGLQSTVSDKANQSEVTQLSDAYNVLVQEKPINLIPDDSNLTKGWAGWYRGTGVTFNRIINNRTEIYSPSGVRIWRGLTLEKGKKYKITFNARALVSGQEISVGRGSANMDRISLTTTGRTYEVIFESDASSDLSIYFHSGGTYEIGNVIVVETTAIGKGQISVLENNINLRVTKGDVLSQINIEAERTLIQSNKLVLDADSVVFTGSAFIPSAQIESLHADKINAGTISTARLDAKNIVTQGLTTNVVKADHILADTALFNNLFTSTLATERLVAQGAWITNANIISLNADKITAGTISADRISTSSLANVEIGGRNLVLNSDDPWVHVDGLTTWHKWATGFIDVEPGETYTFSIDWRKGFGDVYLQYQSYNLDGQYINERWNVNDKLYGTSQNGRNSFTFTLSENVSRIRLGFRIADAGLAHSFDYRQPKLEKGSIATDWSPAPEDIVNDLGSSGKVEIHGGNIKADTLDVNKLTGNLGEFINLSLKAQNSQASLSGSSFKIESIANSQSYIEMSNVPEIRARSANSAMVVMGQGLTNYSVDNSEKFYIGTKIDGSQHGIMIRKNHGWAIMRESDSYGGTPAKYYTVKYGQQRVAVVEALMADPTVTEVPTGNATQFIINSNYLARLNGFSTSTSSTVAAPWPNLTTGDLIKYAEGTPGNESGIQSIYEIWTENNTSVSAFGAHVTFNAGYSGASDRNIKHDIKDTSVEALSHINSLKFKEFKYNSDNRYEPLGVIAQDSGILRVEGEKVESIDIQRSIMLGLKGVQELHEIIKEQAEEIRELKEIINQ